MIPEARTPHLLLELGEGGRRLGEGLLRGGLVALDVGVSHVSVSRDFEKSGAQTPLTPPAPGSRSE